MNQIIHRYTWEDALIEAARDGDVSDGASFMALKLARVINWSPKDGRAPGLYWSNEAVCKDSKISRATFYRNIALLVDAGFFTRINGNLIPCLPGKVIANDIADLTESHLRDTESHY